MKRLAGRTRRAIAAFLHGDTGPGAEARDPQADPSLVKRLKSVEAELQNVRGHLRKINAKLRHLQPGVDALVRAQFIDPSSLPYPQRLTARRFRLYSQHQEDGVLWTLLTAAGMTTRTFVELGSGLSGGNSAMLAGELGWRGLMVDGSPVHISQVARRFPTATAVAGWITRESVNDLILSNGFAGEVDFLSIDIDGNDYWVWEAITACTPRVVCVEYNSMFGAERAVTIPYEPQFDLSQHRFIYYGASLAALARLAVRKGYRLVAVEPTGVNAFFVRNDLAAEIPESTPAQAYRILEKYDVLMKEKGADVYAWAVETGRVLVDVGEV